MAQNEFAIIQQYFSAIGKPAASTVLGIGDDAAVVEVPAGFQQVVSMDTLIAGVHFPLDTSPADIAYKALAVNLSDLAAMAATPNWFLLRDRRGIRTATDRWRYLSRALVDFDTGCRTGAVR